MEPNSRQLITPTPSAPPCGSLPPARSLRSPRTSIESNTFPSHLWKRLARHGSPRHHRRRHLRRRRYGVPRACDRHGGDQPCLCVGRPLVLGPLQPLREPDSPQRHRGAEAALSPASHQRRTCWRARDERSGRRLGCPEHDPACREGRRPLPLQRHQAVDHERARREHAGRLREDRAAGEVQGHHGVHHREGSPRFHHVAKDGQARHARVQHVRVGLPRLRSVRHSGAGPGQQWR